MSRWIEADRLLLELYDLIDEFSELDERGLHSERWCGIMDSKGVIVNAPSIDLVRCRECRWRNENCGMGEHKWCEKLNMSTTPNDFCSYGERKESK